MSIVNIRNIEFKNNPAKFTDPYRINIEFESIAELKDDLEWRLTYVGSAASDQFDQELDSVMVGPVPVGNNTFEFNADPPALSRLPSADDTLSPLGPPVNDLIGVTVIILSALYKDKEFVRVGYYVASNWETSEYQTQVEEGLITGELDKIVRTVEVAQPRVTRFANSWDNPDESLSNPVASSSSSSSIPTSVPTGTIDPLSSALPPPLSAVPAPAAAAAARTTTPSTTNGAADLASSTADEGDAKTDALPEAERVEQEDKFGKDTVGDVGRGQEAGEDVATNGGPSLKEA